MTLQERISEAWKEAMKSRDPRKDALSLIRSELKREAIATREGASGTDLDDEAAQRVLGRMAKQRRESIAEYEKGGRPDLARKEQEELDVIQGFLPAGLSETELEALVDEVVRETGASGPKEMGKVMGPLMKRVAGRADGTAVRSLVQKRLGG